MSNFFIKKLNFFYEKQQDVYWTAYKGNKHVNYPKHASRSAMSAMIKSTRAKNVLIYVAPWRRGGSCLMGKLVPGVYKDSVKGRLCEIVEADSDGVYGIKKLDVNCGTLKFTGKNKIELVANWGVEGSLRTWQGFVSKCGTNISWIGIRGRSSWNMCHN